VENTGKVSALFPQLGTDAANAADHKVVVF